jgi:hypothetical protein
MINLLYCISRKVVKPTDPDPILLAFSTFLAYTFCMSYNELTMCNKQ